MGFLKSLAKALASNSTTQNKEQVVIDHDDSSVLLYVYNDKPLKGLKKGQSFLLDVSPGRHTLRPKSGKAVTITPLDGSVVFSYNGIPVGCIFDNYSSLKCLGNIYSAKVAAKIVGTYKGNGFKVPEVKLSLNSAVLNDWYFVRANANKHCHPVNDYPNYINQASKLRITDSARTYLRLKDPLTDLESVSFYLELDKAESKQLKKCKRNSQATLTKLPVPEGSTRKPEIVLHVDGMEITSFFGRSTKYKQISEFYEENGIYMVYCEDKTGMPFSSVKKWRVILVKRISNSSDNSGVSAH